MDARAHVQTHDEAGALSVADPGLAPRQCGRCRQLFDGDPTLYAGALPEWWLCPDCRIALLGRP